MEFGIGFVFGTVTTIAVGSVLIIWFALKQSKGKEKK